jgi:hypothetical protein
VDAQQPIPERESGRTGQPRTVRLPGFLREDQEVGLGDVIKRATSLAGIKPCLGCARRAEALNHWVTFGGNRSRTSR